MRRRPELAAPWPRGGRRSLNTKLFTSTAAMETLVRTSSLFPLSVALLLIMLLWTVARSSSRINVEVPAG